MDKIDYYENSEFNSAIDFQYAEPLGFWAIGGLEYNPSKILWDNHYSEYLGMLYEFNQQQIEDLKPVVIDEFPTPIAFYFHCFERGCINSKEKLERFKDTYESIIFFLFALVLGEVTYENCSLKDLVKSTSGEQAEHFCFNDLLSDKVSIKLNIIKEILNRAELLPTKFFFTKVVNNEVLKVLTEFNRFRNTELAHLAALSEEQATEKIKQHQEKFFELFQSLTKLSELSLVIQVGTDGSPLKIKFDVFKGHSHHRDIQPFSITAEQLTKSANYLNNQRILVIAENKIINLAPFVHFMLINRGHETRICNFKKKGSNGKYKYEVIGQSEEVDFDKSLFETDINGIKALFNLPVPQPLQSVTMPEWLKSVNSDEDNVSKEAL